MAKRWITLPHVLVAAMLALGVIGPGAGQPVPEEESVLPEGEGRADTFAACTGCHSTAIIRRSRFTRDQWDGLLDWMTERQGMAPLEGEQRALILDYLARHFGPGGQAPRARQNPFLD